MARSADLSDRPRVPGASGTLHCARAHAEQGCAPDQAQKARRERMHIIARTGRRDPFEGRGPPAEAADPMAETA